MASIPIIEASFAHLFVDYLNQAGYPVRNWLTSECLPVSIIKSPDGYVSEYHLRKFIEFAAQSAHLDDLGLKIAETVSMDELGPLTDRIQSEPNLYAGLGVFCRDVTDVNSHAKFWLSEHDGHIWFFRSNPDELNIAQSFAEQFTVMYMVKLVQMFTGPDWHPDHVWLKAPDSSSFKQHPVFMRSLFSTARGLSAIRLPTTEQEIAKIPEQLIPPANRTESLAASLKILLKPYLSETCPDIKLAAELARLSERTLKRRLAEENITYRELLQEARFELACALLENTQLNILDVANAVSYVHPGNFSRAFQRRLNVTPQEYRRLHQRKLSVQPRS